MQQRESISYEYIRGLIDGEGCFTFCASRFPGKERVMIPTFTLAMSERDKNLITKVRDKLKLKNKVYQYKMKIRKDRYNRQDMIILIVRDFGQLKSVIVPLFYGKLVGYKAKQFADWLERIGNDPEVPQNYKFIHKIYKSGFYDKGNRFID